jgi:hypothetical protein
MMCSTDEQQWQKSGWNGASVLQEAPHLRHLLPTLDRAWHDSLREMQPGAREVLEVAPAPELRARCQGGRLRAVPQATCDSHQQALPEVPSQPRRPGSASVKRDTNRRQPSWTRLALGHWQNRVADCPADVHTPTMTLKGAALLALIGTALIAAFLTWMFISNVVNVLRGVDAPVVLFSSFIYAFGCLCVAVFFFVFHRAQS